MKDWIKVFAILFVLPVFALVLFEFAPRIVNGHLVDEFIKQIEKSTEAPAIQEQQKEFARSLRLDLTCSENTEQSRAFIERLQVADVCDDFTHFFWAQLVAAGLIALGAIHLLLTFLFARNAKRSREALLSSFRTSWALSTFFSILILLGQTALAAYTLFYSTVLFTGSYFPKLILALLLCGGWAFFKVAKLLFTPIPIQPHEPTSEEVSEAKAPALWKAVRDVAAQLETAPPDTILLGMSPSFYVTEFPVKHASGISQGRTLYLSAPMMKLLPKDELISIIGHELGHFKGEDTKLTREMTPLLVKAEATMHNLAEGGFVALPAIYAMNVFRYLFETVTGAYRRERELHADAFGARVTNPQTTARALVRYVYQLEAYSAAFHEHLTQKAALEASLAKFQDELKVDENFWSTITTKALPHPFDSHPPLVMRIEKLGFKIDDIKSQVTQSPGTSSFDVLISGENEVLKSAMQEHAARIEDVQTRLEIRTTAHDQLPADVIRRHFPQVVIRARKWSVLVMTLILAVLVVVIPGGMALSATGISLGAQIVCGLIAIGGVFLCWVYVRDGFNQTLTLNHLGLQLGSWHRMLKFDEITEMRHHIQNGNTKVTFHFKEKQAPLARKPLYPWKRKSVSIDLMTFEGKQHDQLVRIYRYFTREIPENGPAA